jgi:hypothetical protein
MRDWCGASESASERPHVHGNTVNIIFEEQQ